MSLPALHKLPTLQDCRLLQLPKIQDARGNLSFLESGPQLPFAIKRVFYLYDVPAGGHRAGHALRTCQQLIIAVAGHFDLVLHADGQTSRIRLQTPAEGLYLPPMIWREVENFSEGAVCLVLASEEYSEAGYVRSAAEYRSLRKTTAGA